MLPIAIAPMFHLAIKRKIEIAKYEGGGGSLFLHLPGDTFTDVCAIKRFLCNFIRFDIFQNAFHIKYIYI